MNTIDKIITQLDFAAQIGASATIDRKDIPVLLEALEPAIKMRADYWRSLHTKIMRLKSREGNGTQH